MALVEQSLPELPSVWDAAASDANSTTDSCSSCATDRLPSCRSASLVARRRAEVWQARRHRRIRGRVDELLRRDVAHKRGSSASAVLTKAGASAVTMPTRQWCTCVTACGHQCFYAHCGRQGPDGREHGPCLTCTKQHGDTCPICLSNLTEQPVVSTRCGHLFHAECLASRVQVGARHNIGGDRLLFDFMECPLCKSPGIERLPSLRRLPELKRQLELKSMVACQRASLGEGRFAFQVCQKCKVPYCSGADDCHSQVSNGLDAVCAPCREDKPAGKPHVCERHGEDFIVWKCRYCCSVATFQCFSGEQQLHVCETCHELVELNTLYDFDTMANKLPLEQYGSCPVRRSVFRGGGRWKRCHQDEGKVMDLSQVKAVEHRLAVVLESLKKCELEIAELQKMKESHPSTQTPSGGLHRLQMKAHSLRVEKDELEARARAWDTGNALRCPFKGLHPPTGIEYCLGCSLCNELEEANSSQLDLAVSTP